MKNWIRDVLTVAAWANAFALMWAVLLGYSQGWFLGLVILAVNIIGAFAIMGSENSFTVLSPGPRMAIFPDDEPLDNDDLMDRLRDFYDEDVGPN